MPMEISATAAPPSITFPPETARIQPQNGASRRRLPSPPPPPPPAIYKECMKNHAAARGGHAVDGCCEFMPSPTSSAALTCAACGCHRNFHRREPPSSAQPPPHFTEYMPHHRHHPPPPPTYGCRSPNSHSPPPISSSYYPSSAPHVLFSLGGGPAPPPPPRGDTTPFGRKRIRTKFSQEQKEKMLGFAEEIGWKMQRGSEATVAKFCGEIGVERGVFKVWMHNHKNTSSFKRDLNLDFGNNGDKIGVAGNGCSSSS